MINYKIHENAELELLPELKEKITQMLIDDPSLPMKVRGNVLSFKEYTIGSIQIGAYSIEIQPRNPVFTLETVFEMLLFESLNNFDEQYFSSGYGDDQTFGISSLATQFYYQCIKLLDFGLTGGFVSKEETGKQISGRLLMENYHPSYIPIKGLDYVKEQYTTNVPANQIIKSAIIKILKLEKRKKIRNDYQLLIKSFVGIDEYKGTLYGLENITNLFHTANIHYPLALEFAIKILKDMKMKFTSGNMTWNAFLYNSNDIFEKYVRKVVAKGISAYVSKWEEPKEIAVLTDGIRRGNKGFIPDILIDYNPNKGSAKAVLDAKNKLFETNTNNIGDILSSADMYQLAFYCDKLKTNLGGLIYPAGNDYRPIQVLIDGSTDFRFVMFTINMKEKISVRHKKLCDAIQRELLFYIR